MWQHRKTSMDQSKIIYTFDTYLPLRTGNEEIITTPRKFRAEWSNWRNASSCHLWQTKQQGASVETRTPMTSCMTSFSRQQTSVITLICSTNSGTRVDSISTRFPAVFIQMSLNAILLPSGAQNPEGYSAIGRSRLIPPGARHPIIKQLASTW